MVEGTRGFGKEALVGGGQRFGVGRKEEKAFEGESGEASGASLILRDPSIGFPPPSTDALYF